MRRWERDGLLLLLAAGASSTDTWSFFGLGRVFTAQMTGNTVMLGMDLVDRSPALARLLTAVVAYAAGVLCGTLAARGVGGHRRWPRSFSPVLAAESLLLVATAVLWARPHPSSGTFWTLLLIALAAAALGVQSAAMQQLRIPGIVTTYISGTWTVVMASLADLLTGHQPKRHRRWQQRLTMQAAVVVVYFLAAVLTGLILRTSPRSAAALPAAAISLVALYSYARGETA